MKRILVSITIAAGLALVLLMGMALEAQAITSTPSPAPAPVRQITGTTFTVGCGATQVSGPCEADCVTLLPSDLTQQHYETLLYAWPLSPTSVITGADVTYIDSRFVNAGEWGDGPYNVWGLWFSGSQWWPSYGATGSFHRTDGDKCKDLQLQQIVYIDIPSGIEIDTLEWWYESEVENSARCGPHPTDNVSIKCSASLMNELCPSYNWGGAIEGFNDLICENCSDADHKEFRATGVDGEDIYQCARIFCEVDVGYINRAEFESEIINIRINGSPITGTAVTTAALTQPCVVSQAILFDGIGLGGTVIGKEIDADDYAPYGLDPFINGVLQLFGPVSSTTVYYEFEPDCRSGADPGGGGGGEYSDCTWPDMESHLIAWSPISFTLPWDLEGLCTPPSVITDTCPMPDWPVWDVGNWVAWLNCKMGLLGTRMTNQLTYDLCMLVAEPILDLGNVISEQIYDLYTGLDIRLSQLIVLMIDFFSQLGAFLRCYIPDWLAWLGAAFTWFMQFALRTWPRFADFVVMAVLELVPWLTDLIVWFATDFVSATFGKILDLVSTIVSSSSSTLAFITQQFAATIVDSVYMIGYIVDMIVYVIDLLAALITGLSDALNSDTEAELFTSLTFFWRGIDFFEEMTSGTPLALLNMVAIGLIGINLVWWTIGQVSGMIDDLMQI